WQRSEDGATLTLTLKSDLAWSDGTPITAYDVFFSYLVTHDDDVQSRFASVLNAEVTAAAPLDAQTITFRFSSATCDALTVVNIPIIPAHAYEGDFAERAAAVFDDTNDVVAAYTTWQATYPDLSYRYVGSVTESLQPSITYGDFAPDPGYVVDAGALRLTASIDTVQTDAFQVLAIGDSNTVVDNFINGDLNFLAQPPVNRRADLRAVPGVQFYQLPGAQFDYLGFNTADPDPRHVRGYDDPEGQGHHPIFGDPRVVQALRLAIDVDALIQVAVQGDGTRVAVNQAPTSWAYDATLPLSPYDPDEARRQLEAAGWRAVAGSSTRRCVDCLYGTEGDPLRFSLLVDESSGRQAINATLIEQQLGAIGIEVQTRSVSNTVELNDELRLQRFDAFLTTYDGGYPYAPDVSAWFTQSEDVPELGANVTSYVNPDLEALLTEARTLPGCSRQARSALYQQAAQALSEDVPYIWLYAPDEVYVASGNVRGFAPYPSAALWNITAWSVTGR
ncbi:MAG: hypothetical protein H7Y11_07835, partial [Armatimonadetes bacterium]|nr:hypothetical protein [Anaerolineae bacterium]